MEFRPATPVSRSVDLTPPSAPRYGSFRDEWGPATTSTRKSARVLSQRPAALGQNLTSGGSEHPSSLTLATPQASVASTPEIPRIRVDRTSTSKIPRPTNSRMTLLPTPTKTPKKPNEKPIAGISSISRNLFNVRPDSIEDAFPTPKKDRGKYSDALDEEEEAPIKIYTDSKERIPELDLHPDNVFLDRPAVTGPFKKRRVTAMVEVPGEGQISLKDAVKRTDGSVFNFRGQRIFKFHSESRDDVEPTGSMMSTSFSAELDAIVPSRLRGPLTRSAVPKLLFPTEAQLEAKKQRQVVTDEEAPTDIEESEEKAESMVQDDAEERTTFLSTPNRSSDRIVTPTAPKFGSLVSPPSTVRSTRSSKKADEVFPPGSSPEVSMGGDGACDERPSKNNTEPVTPFAAWRRTKARYGASSHKKRSADEQKVEAQVSKRHRRGSRGVDHTEAI